MRTSRSTSKPDGRKLLSRRSVLLGCVQGGVMLVLAGRLFQLQILESHVYRDLAEDNRIDVRLLPPRRGIIYDRNGTPIALNSPNYSINIVAEEAGDLVEALSKLSAIIPMSDQHIMEKIAEIGERPEFLPVTVAENVTWEQVAAVSANSPALPGISADVGTTRFYPFGHEFAHLVGYVGRVSAKDREDAKNEDPLLDLPQFEIGKIGVEKQLDRELRGQSGTRKIEVNVDGRVIRELERTNPQRGTNLQISIDSRLQNYMFARLGSKPASAVLLDLRDGTILASASTPTFDPNPFVTGITQSAFDELNENKFAPFLNRTLQGAYPPGSTFKMVTALAALNLGLIDKDQTFFCNGEFEASGRTFHCWREGGHGAVNLQKSLAESCDVYYYKLGQLVGIENITAMARRLGLGVRPNLPIPNIKQGLTPTREWKQLVRGDSWVIGDTLNAAIGQGFVLASTMQIAIMVARLATSREYEPRLLMSKDGVRTEPSEFKPIALPDEHLDIIKEGMFGAINGKKGTAYEARAADESFLIAGKTGTSQVRAITPEERRIGLVKNEDLPWEQRDHALFCGYGPHDNPKFAVAVIVEHGGSGSEAAAPIGRDLLMRAHYGAVPPLEAYPREFHSKIEQEQQELQLRPTDPAGPERIRA